MLDPARANIQPWERYVVIGSDGDPLPAFRRGRAIAESDTLRMSPGDIDDDGVTIYSFAIWNTGSVRYGPSIRQFAQRIAGAGGDPDGEPGLPSGDPNHWFEVASVNDMHDLFVNSMSDVACQTINPLSPPARYRDAGGNPRIFAFMRPKNDRTQESRIMAVIPGDPDPVRLMPSGKVRIEDEPSCNLLETQRWELVIRYDQPFLAQLGGP